MSASRATNGNGTSPNGPDSSAAAEKTAAEQAAAEQAAVQAADQLLEEQRRLAAEEAERNPQSYSYANRVREVLGARRRAARSSADGTTQAEAQRASDARLARHARAQSPSFDREPRQTYSSTRQEGGPTPSPAQQGNLSGNLPPYHGLPVASGTSHMTDLEQVHPAIANDVRLYFMESLPRADRMAHFAVLETDNASYCRYWIFVIGCYYSQQADNTFAVFLPGEDNKRQFIKFANPVYSLVHAGGDRFPCLCCTMKSVQCEEGFHAEVPCANCVETGDPCVLPAVFHGSRYLFWHRWETLNRPSFRTPARGPGRRQGPLEPQDVRARVLGPPSTWAKGSDVDF